MVGWHHRLNPHELEQDPSRRRWRTGSPWRGPQSVLGCPRPSFSPSPCQRRGCHANGGPPTASPAPPWALMLELSSQPRLSGREGASPQGAPEKKHLLRLRRSLLGGLCSRRGHTAESPAGAQAPPPAPFGVRGAPWAAGQGPQGRPTAPPACHSAQPRCGSKFWDPCWSSAPLVPVSFHTSEDVSASHIRILLSWAWSYHGVISKSKSWKAQYT